MSCLNSCKKVFVEHKLENIKKFLFSYFALVIFNYNYFHLCFKKIFCAKMNLLSINSKDKLYDDAET